jgi:hypothetical protein
MHSTSLPQPRLLRSGLRIAGLTALVVTMAATSCDWSGNTEKSAPDGDLGPVASRVLDSVGPQNDFFPLEIGDRWHVDRYEVFEFFPTGSDVSDGAEEFHFEEDWVLDQTEELFGRTYVVQSRTIVQDVPQPDIFYEWIRFRQDRAGLYEADVAIGDPPGAGAKGTLAARESQAAPGTRLFDLAAFGPRALDNAAAFRAALAELDRRRAQVRGALHGEHVAGPPGGVLPNELTRLGYPLHPGAHWWVRDGALEASVERQESLVTPAGRFPAWRIRLTWAIPDFDDTILTWFGRCGMLKFHFEGALTLTGMNGEVLGTMHVVETDVVEDLDIQGRPCGTRPDRPVLVD